MNVTGSSLPLLRSCQWWARPEVQAPRTQEVTEAMEIGTQVHALIESHLMKTAAPIDTTSTEAFDLYGVWLEWWQQYGIELASWQAEVAYAYRPADDTSRCLGVSMARKYEVEAGEIAGTIDALHVSRDKAIVIDWKTGMDFAGLTADASENWQLRLYALAVSRAHKVDAVQVMIVRVTPYGVRHTEYLLDAMELDAIAAEVAALVGAVPASKPQPGLYCRRCRAVAVCPATAEATVALAPVEPVSIAITSPEQASAALVRLRQVQAACEQMEALLKTYAQENKGIALPNGKRWTQVPQERESISLTGPDYAAGMAALQAVGADKAVETKHSTSKAAIERVLKEQGLKGKELRAKMDELMSDLRASGVVRSVTIEAWREVE